MPNARAPQKPAPSDVLGQFLDRDARLDAPDVRPAQHDFVEGDVPRMGQGDFLGSFGHQIFSTTCAGSHFPYLTSRHPQSNASLMKQVVVRTLCQLSLVGHARSVEVD